MLWNEFFPYVLPNVIGCPIPIAEQHVRLAAIEFCRRTGCWQKTLDPVNTNGIDNLIEMFPDTNTQINKVKAVAVGGIDWPLVDSVSGLALIRSGSQQSFCFTQDNKILQIQPLQENGIPVLIDAVLTPTITSPSIDNVIAYDYMSDIAMGAAASILRIPKQDWSDPLAAQSFQQQFNSRIATASAKVARGFVNQKIRSHVSYL